MNLQVHQVQEWDRKRRVKITAACYMVIWVDHWIQLLIKTQFCKYRRNSTVNPLRKCFILTCCWFEDGIVKVNTFFNFCHSPRWNWSLTFLVWTVLLPAAVAEVVWQKCDHVEAAEDPVSMGAQGATCINPVLQQRPCKTPVKATVTRLLNFMHLNSTLMPKEFPGFTINIYTQDLLL